MNKSQRRAFKRERKRRIRAEKAAKFLQQLCYDATAHFTGCIAEKDKQLMDIRSGIK